MAAVNLGSKHRLFTQDLRLVRLLPESTSLVFIGVNVGRFCNGEADPPVVLPEPSAAARQTLADPRSSTRIWPDSRKRRIAAEWMRERWPHFRAHYRYNLRVLARVIKASKARGQHPVIVDLPRNMPIIGHQLDRPKRLYHLGCRALAKRYDIPYFQFQGRTRLTNRDFSDLWHTIASGQVKWQRELSVTTARLLKRYEVAPGPTPTPTASPSPWPATIHSSEWPASQRSLNPRRSGSQ